MPWWPPYLPRKEDDSCNQHKDGGGGVGGDAAALVASSRSSYHSLGSDAWSDSLGNIVVVPRDAIRVGEATVLDGSGSGSDDDDNDDNDDDDDERQYDNDNDECDQSNDANDATPPPDRQCHTNSNDPSSGGAADGDGATWDSTTALGAEWCDLVTGPSVDAVVAIPSFLQPLLGMEYLPYLTSLAQSYAGLGEGGFGGDGSIHGDAPSGSISNAIEEGDCVWAVAAAEATTPPRHHSLSPTAPTIRTDHIVDNEDDNLMATPVARPTPLIVASSPSDLNDDDDDDDEACSALTGVSDDGPTSDSAPPRSNRGGRYTPRLWNKILQVTSPLPRSERRWRAAPSPPTRHVGEVAAAAATASIGSPPAAQQWRQRNKELQACEQRAKLAQRREDELTAGLAKAQSQVSQLQQALQSAVQKLGQQSQSLSETQGERKQWQAQADALRAELLHSLQQQQQPPSYTPETLRSCTLYSVAPSEPESLPIVAAAASEPAPPPLPTRRRSWTEDDRRSPLQTPPLVCTATTAAVVPPEVAPSDVRPNAETALRPRAYTAPPRAVLRKSSSSLSFMRVSDLEGPAPSPQEDARPETGGVGDDQSSLSCSVASLSKDRAGTGGSADFYCLDENLPWALDQLWNLAWSVVTDESDRFRWAGNGRLGPHNCTVQSMGDLTSASLWPVLPWHMPIGEHVLLWVGDVLHKGHGHDWPVVKARGLVRCPPRQLAEFLLDSSQVGTYNKISLGRHDVNVLQDSFDITEQDSPYGFPGVAKITRSIVKPRLLPKSIETVSLWHAKPVPTMPGAFMIVNRSVWDEPSSSSGTTTGNDGEGGWTAFSLSPSLSSQPQHLRSEMLLGVQLCLPCDNTEDAGGPGWCELTTITHVLPRGVPELMAKRMAPSSASTMIQNLQAHFHNGS